MRVNSLFSGVARARNGLLGRLADVFSGRRPVDDQVWETLEEALVESDMGVELVLELLTDLRNELPRRAGTDELFRSLKARLVDLLGPAEPIAAPGRPGNPLVIAVVGVNGTGKTTTIGKLAHRYAGQGARVIVGAGDTFRAAAIEQLEVWAKRAGAAFVSHQAGADPAAVAFDTIEAAKARGHEVVILDTAGRLHTRKNLMEELRKTIRVAGRALEGAPHETLLVLDATMGSNTFAQAKTFGEAAELTGVILTKLDSSARGGTVFRIRRELGVPVKLLGTGEGIADLIDFEPASFVDALIEPAARAGGDA